MRQIQLKLNQPTRNIGTSPSEIEIIIRNFEDSLIEKDDFAETLTLFNRRPDEFGFSVFSKLAIHEAVYAIATEKY